jgi:pimeloyl-ACP methyl ester carboxylesterase
MKYRYWILLLYLHAFLISACSSIPPVSERIDSARELTSRAGFTDQLISTPSFELVGFGKSLGKPSDTLALYIEGDGHAWKTASLPSDNPTPINPLALRLAMQDPRSAVAYLARPCQFVSLPSRNCSEAVWTSARFSPAVVDAMNEAVDKLKKDYGAKNLILIGYSGGGAIAVLIAAKRSDVQALMTVAGNLDTDAWVRLYGLEPLSGSLNPASVAPQLRNLPQTHFIGGKDEVIPKAVVQSYLMKMSSPNRAKVIELPNDGHVCCWGENWRNLLKEANTD